MRRESDGIGEEIVKHLLDAVLIADEVADAGVGIDLELDAVGREPVLNAFRGGIDGLARQLLQAVLGRAQLAEGLIDERQLLVYPVVLGSGSKLFREGMQRLALKLSAHEAFENGVLHLTYAPAS